MYGFSRKVALSSLLVLLLLVFETHGTRYELNEDNWRLMLKGEWMVQFIAPWCPSCKILAPIWERFEKVSEKYNIKIGTVDITKSPALSGRFFVTSLPSIYHVIDGKFRFYRGQRDIDALIDFVKLKQWEDVAPISGWNDPNAYHMGLLSNFFRISLMLKEWNARLQHEFGFSVYSSYGIFVVGTILIAALFGLLLLTVLDFVCPTKKHRDFVELEKTEADGDGKVGGNSAKFDVDGIAEKKVGSKDAFDCMMDADELGNFTAQDMNHTFVIKTDDGEEIPDVGDIFDDEFIENRNLKRNYVIKRGAAEEHDDIDDIFDDEFIEDDNIF